MAETAISFTSTTAAKLSQLTVKNGQIIALEDADGFYYDMSNSRHPVSGVEVLSALSGSGVTGKVYVYNSSLYIWDGTQFVNTDTNTTYTTGVGLTYSGTTFKANLKDETTSALTAATRGATTDREYAVGVDANGNLSVNVPWTTSTAGVGLASSGSTLKAHLKSETASALTAATGSATADREYPVEVDANGDLAVNVPWVAGGTSTDITRTASTYVPGTTVEAALQNLGQIRKISVTTSTWAANSDSTGYSFKAVLSSTDYTANSAPVWTMIGVGTVTTKTEQAECAKVEQAYFTASNITLYATAKPSVNLYLYVNGC